MKPGLAVAISASQDVDAHRREGQGDRRQRAYGAAGHSRRRPLRDGRRSAGHRVLHHARRQPGGFAGVPGQSRPGKCNWNELVTSDHKAALAFLRRRCSAGTYNDKMPMGEMGDYCFIDHAGERIGAMMTASAGRADALDLLFPRARRSTPRRNGRQGRRHRDRMGPMEVPGGDRIIVGYRPARRRVRLGRRQVEERRHGEQDDHLPVVRPRPGPRGGRILRREFPDSHVGDGHASPRTIRRRRRARKSRSNSPSSASRSSG